MFVAGTSMYFNAIYLMYPYTAAVMYLVHPLGWWLLVM